MTARTLALAALVAAFVVLYADTAWGAPARPTIAEARAYLGALLQQEFDRGSSRGYRVDRCRRARSTHDGRRRPGRCRVTEFGVLMLADPREISAGGFVVRDHSHRVRVWRGEPGDLRDDSPYLWPRTPENTP